MKRLKHPLIYLAWSLALYATQASSQGSPADSKYYLRVSYGLATLDSAQPLSVDLFHDATTAAHLTLGYRINRTISIEASHLNYENDVSTEANGTPRTELKLHGTGAAIVVGTALSPNWWIDGRVGLHRMSARFHNYSSSQVPIGGSTESSWQPWWGFTSQWALGSTPFALGFEYVGTKVEYGFPLNSKGTSHVFALSANYRF